MNEEKPPVSIVESPLEVESTAIYGRVGQIEKRQKDNEDTMRLVVIVLLVMVGAMIFSLQIAISQSQKSQDINIHLVN